MRLKYTQNIKSNKLYVKIDINEITPTYHTSQISLFTNHFGHKYNKQSPKKTENNQTKQIF